MADAVATSRLALRDRPFVDVLDLSFRFVNTAFGPLAKLTLVLVPIPILLTLWVGLSAGWVWGWLLALFMSRIVGAPITVLVGQFVFERDPSVRTALRRGLAAYGKLFLLDVAVGTAATLGLFMFFIPGVWVMVVAFFVTESVLLERTGVVAAFERSTRLAASAPGDSLLARIVTGCILVLGPMFVDVVGRMLLEQVFSVHAPKSMFEEGGSALAVIGFWLSVPYAALLRFLVYANVRTRNEGWDIQTAFATLALRTEEAST